MIKVAIVGAGYWGPNLIRNFHACSDTEVVAVCDSDRDALHKALTLYPGVAGVDSLEQLLTCRDLDAVAISTPVSSHATMCLAALRAGKHVLVEKPLATSVKEAEEVVDLATKLGLTLMVDHTYVYSGAVRKMYDLIQSGELGDVYFVDSVRINLGIFQHDVNVVWDLAPHDLSILDYLLGRLPKSVSAFGTCHADSESGIEDVAYLNLDFGGCLLASCHVSWLSPVKVRHFIVGGNRKSVVYNDLQPGEKIKIYDRGITVSHDTDARRGLLIGYRAGDMWSPRLDQSEPLQQVVRHFAACIRENRRPITDGEAGVRIVRILDAAQRSIKAQGGRITL